MTARLLAAPNVIINSNSLCSLLFNTRAQGNSKMLERSKIVSGAFEIDRDEMMALADRIGGEGPWEVKCAVLARQMQVSFSRAKTLFYGTAKRIDSNEIETARKLARTAERKAQEAQRHAELLDLRARLARLEERLAIQDEEFHGPARDALRQSVGPVR